MSCFSYVNCYLFFCHPLLCGIVPSKTPKLSMCQKAFAHDYLIFGADMTNLFKPFDPYVQKWLNSWLKSIKEKSPIDNPSIFPLLHRAIIDESKAP